VNDVSPPIHVVKGSDSTLLAESVRRLVADLVGDADRSMAVDELTVGDYRSEGSTDADIAPVVRAAQTPPFLTDRRVVLARDAGAFSTADRVAPLVDYLQDPLSTTVVVLVWEKAPGQQKLAAVPKKLRDAVAASHGVEVDAGPPKKGERAAFLDAHFADAGLALDRESRALVADNLGEDVGRVAGLAETLLSVHGPGAKLRRADVEPYLGQQSDLAPWDLTDAIDAGGRTEALGVLRRMLDAGRHPMQLMFTLHGHYGNLLKLDGAGATSVADVTDLTGQKGFPAKKAFQLSGRLESDQVREAVLLLAQADVDLRGAKGWPDELVMEVLVARLASRCAPRR
jgi:DNA polymerase-3 subunit delta